MDFRTLNRAQLLLNVGARMEKTGGKVGDTFKYIGGAAKSVGLAGHEGMKAAVGSLQKAKHPVLATLAGAAPVAAGLVAAKKGYDKYQMWKAIREAKRQGYM